VFVPPCRFRAFFQTSFRAFSLFEPFFFKKKKYAATRRRVRLWRLCVVGNRIKITTTTTAAAASRRVG
jgi:hypothetical protein